MSAGRPGSSGVGLMRRILAAMSRGFARDRDATPAPAVACPRTLVFTDLDGALFDAATLRPGESAAAIERLRRAEAHVVVVTGKTFGEFVPLWEELKLGAAFAVEGGTAVYLPRDLFAALPADVRVKENGRFRVVETGPRRAEVVSSLAECARDAGATIHGFAEMSVGQVARLTGLDRAGAAQAMRRAYSEPFILREGDPALLEAALLARDLRLTRGSRLYHAHGPADKGTAARLIASCYRALGARVLATAVGHAHDDLALLRAVDRAFALPTLGGAFTPGILKSGAIPVEAGGPRGFSMVVEALLDAA